MPVTEKTLAGDKEEMQFQIDCIVPLGTDRWAFQQLLYRIFMHAGIPVQIHNCIAEGLSSEEKAKLQ